jgi:hypothetical protein
MKEKLILTDIDGVVLDWATGFENYLSEHHNIEIVDPTQYTAHLRWNGTREQLKTLTWHFNMSSWMADLEPFRDSVDVIKKLGEEGWRFIAITSMHVDQKAHALRVQNLKKLYGDVWQDVICLATGADKDEALLPWKDSGYVWIEDKFSNARLGADMGLDSLLMRHEHNAKFDDSRITKVDNWQQIYYYINKQ